MSDTAPDLGGEQPDTCPHCGTGLVRGTVDLSQTPGETESADEQRASFQAGEMVAVDYCPNPDCPAGKPA